MTAYGCSLLRGCACLGGIVTLCIAGEAVGRKLTASATTGLGRALADSCVHGGVAACVWAGALLLALTPGDLPFERTGRQKRRMRQISGDSTSAEVRALARLGQAFGSPPAPKWRACAASILCAALAACALDADHFAAARSLSLEDASALSGRPPGHAVLFIVLVCMAVVAATRLRAHALLLLVAWGTHQLRDALRRGLWLWPLGSTPKLPLQIYALTCAALAAIVTCALRAGKEATAPAAREAVAQPADAPPAPLAENLFPIPPGIGEGGDDGWGGMARG